MHFDNSIKAFVFMDRVMMFADRNLQWSESKNSPNVKQFNMLAALIYNCIRFDVMLYYDYYD
jgi:hypothetical protein